VTRPPGGPRLSQRHALRCAQAATPAACARTLLFTSTPETRPAPPPWTPSPRAPRRREGGGISSGYGPAPRAVGGVKAGRSSGGCAGAARCSCGCCAPARPSWNCGGGVVAVVVVAEMLGGGVLPAARPCRGSAAWLWSSLPLVAQACWADWAGRPGASCVPLCSELSLMCRAGPGPGTGRARLEGQAEGRVLAQGLGIYCMLHGGVLKSGQRKRHAPCWRAPAGGPPAGGPPADGRCTGACLCQPLSCAPAARWPELGGRGPGAGCCGAPQRSRPCT
jgi:hypothetical protein